jgi:hypothetical protein
MSKGDNYYVDEIAPPARKERGCFFYGCLFSLILAAAVALLLVIVFFFLYRFASQKISKYTDTVPMAIPAPDMPEEEVKALKERVDAFKKAVDEGEESTLTLTGPELNALINSDDDMKGRAAVDIEGEQLKGQVSIPFPFPGLGQRYLNGKASLKASLVDGVLIVTLQELEVKGKPLPPEVMSQLRAENLAQEAYKDPDNAKILRKIKSLEIKDGRVTIRSRTAADDEAEKTKEESGEDTVSPPEPKTEMPDPDAPKAVPGLIGDFPPEPPEPPVAPDRP